MRQSNDFFPKIVSQMIFSKLVSVLEATLEDTFVKLFFYRRLKMEMILLIFYIKCFSVYII